MKKILLTSGLLLVCSLSFVNWTVEPSTTNLAANSNTSSNLNVYTLSDAEKAKIDNVFNNFLKKLEKKWTDNTLKTLSKLISKIDEMINTLSVKSSSNTARSIEILTYLKSLASKGFEVWNSTVSEITKQTVYIKSIYEKDWNNYIETEIINFWTWDEASKQLELNEPETCKAMKQEDQTDKCYPLNDYYLKTTWKISTYKVENNVKILMQTYTQKEWEMMRNEEINYDALKTIINIWKESYGNMIKYNTIPFHIELSNGNISKITEQFIP